MNKENVKRLIFVESDDTRRYPPEISVLHALKEIDSIELIVCSLCPSDYIKDFCSRNHITCIDAHGIIMRNHSYGGLRVAVKIHDYVKNKKLLWKAIKSNYNDGDALWINSYSTLKLLGQALSDYKYIIHLFELIHETKMFYKLPLPKFDLEHLLKNAYRVIECEYNRACITQAWFDLKLRPVVLPNKLYLGNDENSNFSVDHSTVELLDRLKEKKIILYQGILGPERPVGVFAEAISEMGKDYVMIVMSNSKMEKRYDNVYEIGFINPPDHLYVTQRAYIGILYYKASKLGFAGNDCLNSIFCAPNKIFEYSKYALPMIGNDIPGLQYSIGATGSGLCLNKTTKEAIKDAIQQIDRNYMFYQNNSRHLYESVDIKGIIEKEIISED